MLSSAAVRLIEGYRRHVSPRRRQSCAHRVLYGSRSCSEFGRDAFACTGFIQASISLFRRLRACQRSAVLLSTHHEPTESNLGDSRNLRDEFKDSCACWPALIGFAPRDFRSRADEH